MKLLTVLRKIKEKLRKCGDPHLLNLRIRKASGGGGGVKGGGGGAGRGGGGGKRGCTERRWFVCVSLAMLFTVLVASAGIYFGCKSWQIKIL